MVVGVQNRYKLPGVWRADPERCRKFEAKKWAFHAFLKNEEFTRGLTACGECASEVAARKGKQPHSSTESKYSSAITVADKEGIIQTSPLNGLAACAATGEYSIILKACPLI